MLSAVDIKDARIEFKTTKDIKSLLQEASNAMGMDLSSFLISTAVQRAKEIVKEENILTLSRQEWKDLQEILDKPQKATEEFKELMRLEGFES